VTDGKTGQHDPADVETHVDSSLPLLHADEYCGGYQF